MIRISKYLSMCGVTSRRGAEAMVSAGRVTVNNETLQKVGTVIDESQDVVKVDGNEVRPVTEKVYILLNKPKMVMTTLFDPFKRRTVRFYLKRLRHRVYPVGRLDYDTEGVLLLTNDGDLAYRLAHPKYQIPRVYEALVTGHFKVEASDAIARGIKLDDGATGRAQVSVLGFVRNSTRLRLILTEGRKREVKQLCKKVGHPVKQLRRAEFAGITARNLKPGQWRYLSDKEVGRLQRLTDIDEV